MKRKLIVTVILIILLATVAVFQNKYPIPALLAILKIETNLTNIVKIDNSPVRYLVGDAGFKDSENGVKIVQAEGGSEWMQDFIIDGNRYRADWTIFLGRYRIYTVKISSAIK